ncbi:gamma-glutamylcyclotransferase [Chryseobacterium carnipullorum]|uniref:AIG2-like family n=1 Tax=Chryseobacterium carnipullorum TaxID=1124835 RepID=A0A1M7L0C1_CHRCU|nr:gamma-glutamylcyclotransferase family protein [Chryseobacterium carnipullorum]AZA49641.1 gamma-glutamylcyclotransferase [Chryseobacterium carnipullorum]AZA64535.1 gamma-glutamylcyclotransferase [Chryseobacterium carnipullorum]SHM70931.1 Gamma-glutamyl cyclotransferase, AIG2-like [Chryseobacterium carnipullorum]STC95084.1 AIG2-like family [Chryseobacterium carnipullorum]HBV17602.1 gamma-glutamylcyclotransferase [Chryseobacterium carnipullorum]
MTHLFSYGTLQKEQVQLETFGRLLEGEKDILTGYKLSKVEITDPEVLRKSGQKYHPILVFSGNSEDEVEGMLFEVTEEEILQADEYEVDDYKRVETVFKSGKKGCIYIGK